MCWIKSNSKDYCQLWSIAESPHNILQAIYYMKIIKLVNPNIFYRCTFIQAEHILSIPI